MKRKSFLPQYLPIVISLVLVWGRLSSPPRRSASLFSDDFEDGDAEGWSPQTSSRWEVRSDNGSLRYFLNTTNYQSPDDIRLGELAVLNNFVWGDLDNDNDLDLVLGAKIYLNNAGTFTEASVVLPEGAAAVGDYDNDGIWTFCFRAAILHNPLPRFFAMTRTPAIAHSSIFPPPGHRSSAHLPSGTYLYRLRAGSFVASKTMALVR